MSQIDPSSVRVGSELCSRRVCIIGARGVGKSKALAEVFPKLSNWAHVIGSDILNRHLKRYDIASIAELDEAGQDVIRQLASEEMRGAARSDLEGFICEGHAAILTTPSSRFTRLWRRIQVMVGKRKTIGDTVKAFTDLDEAFFNEVILIEARPEVIQHRRANDAHKRRSTDLDDIIEDINAERNFAAEICRQSGATLRVLDAEMEDLLAETLLAVLNSRSPTVETVAMRHQADIVRVASGYRPEYPNQPVFLFDADGTLSPHDVSKVLFEVFGKEEKAKMKANFDRSGYNHYSFILHNHLHLQQGIARLRSMSLELGRLIRFYPDALDCLRQAQKRGRVIILTAGVPQVWRAALEFNGIIGIDVHGLVDFDNKLVLDEQGKETFAATLKRAGFRVVATGDGKIDTGMLRVADSAFVVYKMLPPYLGRLRPRERRTHEQSKRLGATRLALFLSEHPRAFQVMPIASLHIEGLPPSEFSTLVTDALDADYQEAIRNIDSRRNYLLNKFFDGLKSKSSN